MKWANNNPFLPAHLWYWGGGNFFRQRNKKMEIVQKITGCHRVTLALTNDKGSK
jgi:hypothetical protein